MSESRIGDDLDINPADENRLGVTTGRPKKRRTLLLVSLGIALCLLCGGAGLAWKNGWITGHKDTASKNEAASAPAKTTLLSIPSIISSLDNGDGRPVYVKMTTRVEIAGVQNEAALRQYIPQIQDIFQTYLHETRPQEIRGNGVYRLRETLLRRLRVEIAPLKITNFYITEFLIQ